MSLDVPVVGLKKHPYISLRGFVFPSIGPSVRPSIHWSVSQVLKSFKMAKNDWEMQYKFFTEYFLYHSNDHLHLLVRPFVCPSLFKILDASLSDWTCSLNVHACEFECIHAPVFLLLRIYHCIFHCISQCNLWRISSLFVFFEKEFKDAL